MKRVTKTIRAMTTLRPMRETVGDDLTKPSTWKMYKTSEMPVSAEKSAAAARQNRGSWRAEENDDDDVEAEARLPHVVLVLALAVTLHSRIILGHALRCPVLHIRTIILGYDDQSSGKESVVRKDGKEETRHPNGRAVGKARRAL